jgi:hypothetical protein
MFFIFFLAEGKLPQPAINKKGFVETLPPVLSIPNKLINGGTTTIFRGDL